MPLPPTTHVGKVRLAFSDLDRSIAFYTQTIGLRLIESDGMTATLGADKPLLVLDQQQGVMPLGGRQQRIGIYHFAVLLPTRRDLANFVNHLSEKSIRFGASDHLASEATYLTDPDGLMVEVYADRPRSEWTHNGSEIVLATDPLNFVELQSHAEGTWTGAPALTTIGHMHFFVRDLDEANRFYCDAMGFTIMSHIPQALFVAAGGYHHHVGLNTWAADAPMAADNEPRLLYWELILPSNSDVADVAARLTAAGYTQESGTGFVDAYGIQVHPIAQTPAESIP